MVESVALGILATLVAIILHELAHGMAAYALGDGTARAAGRLTLNPFRHVDPFGSVFVPAFLAISQVSTIGRVAFLFGWAKPVPVNAAALRWGGWATPRQLMAVVALAGPAMNFLLAYLGALALRGGVGLVFLEYFISINLLLGLFNLIPMPPMDGGRIAVGLLPLPLARRWAKLEKYGILVVLGALFILPTALAQLGLHFDPLHDGLNAILPGAVHVLMRLAGYGNGG